MPTLSWKQGTWDSAASCIGIPIASFPFPGKRGHLFFTAAFSGSSFSYSLRISQLQNKKASSAMSHYELRCRECGRTWGNQPRSICDDCFSPLEVAYDYDALKASVSRERISQRPPNMWRYSELLPLPQGLTRGCR